jgi:hypothetical protein
MQPLLMLMKERTTLYQQAFFSYKQQTLVWNSLAVKQIAMI